MKRYCLYLFILIGISCSAELKAQKNGTVYKGNDRSEERRVGKECRSRWSPYH